MYGTPLEWEAIRDNLTTHYADKRNETNLIKDLHSINQNYDTVEKYFSKIIDIQSTIINHIKLNETSNIIIKAKKDLYQEMCLSTFLTGLREPLGSMVRAMQPSNIQEAFQYCLKEQNIQYAKKSNHQIPMVPRKPLQVQPFVPIHKIQSPLPPFQSFQTPYKPQYFNHNPFYNNPNRNINPGLPRRNNFQQSFPTPNLPNRNNFQQSFSNPNLPNRNGFQQNFPPNLPPRNNFQQPLNKPATSSNRKFELMDTTSNMNKYTQPTYNQNRPFFQSTGPPRFHSQELFNMENQELDNANHQDYYPNLDPNDENDAEYDYSQDPEIEEEDFRQEASDQLDSSN